MRKIICALFGLVLSISAFADGQPVATKTDPRIPIPWWAIEVVVRDNVDNADLVSDLPAFAKKYDEIYNASPDKKLTTDDIWKICKAGKKIHISSICYERILLPVLDIINVIMFADACLDGTITGMKNGVPQCIDDVFITEYKYSENGKTKTRKSTKPYAENIVVPRYTAFGLAIEYIMNDGFKFENIRCTPKVEHDWINCTAWKDSSQYNYRYYTFKFAGTNSTSGSVENVSYGICAANKRISYYTGTGAYGCKDSCTQGVKETGSRFGVTTKTTPIGMLDRDNTGPKFCAIAKEDVIRSSLRKYPGYPEMTTAFGAIQTVLDVNLVNILETYVRAQDIDVRSFRCDWSPKHMNDRMLSEMYTNSDGSVHETGVPTSSQDILTCYINGIPVDFEFDDLYESAKSDLQIGRSGMKCLLMKRDIGGTATFDGANCKGPGKDQCLGYTDKNGNHVQGLNDVIPGGTHWDSDTGFCVFNDAASARRTDKIIKIAGGTAFVLAVTVASGGRSLLVLVAEVGGSLALDWSYEAINRFYEERPNKLATEFIHAAENCGLTDSDETKACSNKTCIKNMVGKFMASVGEIIGDGAGTLNDDQLKLFDGVNERINNCLTDAEIENAAKKSEILIEDQLISKVSTALMALGFIVCPSNVVGKLKNLKNTYRLLSRAKLKPVARVRESVRGAWHNRIRIDNTDLNKVNSISKELNKEHLVGFLEMDKGEQYIRIYGVKYDNIQNIRGIDFDDLKQYGVYNAKAGDYLLTGLVDNSGFFNRLNSVYNREIARINKTPVKIVDAGSIDGRAIVVVDVGGRNIPFYVSTGTAGKIDVPTGKWEVFWGIGGSGWFNKTIIEEITSHYGSEELRYIANTLDEVLGDPRNRLYLMSSKARAQQGAVGLIGDIDNMPGISTQSVNSGLKYIPNYSNKSGEPNMRNNIEDIKSYLRSLR